LKTTRRLAILQFASGCLNLLRYHPTTIALKYPKGTSVNFRLLFEKGIYSAPAALK
jgi:hypothetical protein